MNGVKILSISSFLQAASSEFRWVVCGAYVAFLTVMSLQPRVPLLPRSPFDHFDKVEHFGAYGVYAALVLWTAPVLHHTKWRWFVITVAFCGTYGIVMEILQATISGGARTGSIADAAANLGGTLCAAVVAMRMPSLFVSGNREDLEREP